MIRNVTFTAFFLGCVVFFTCPGTSSALTIHEFDFESPGGYTTEHDGGLWQEFSTGSDVFGRNDDDANWNGFWGAMNGDWFFGWRDPEGQDIGTIEPFVFVSDEIDVGAYISVEVTVHWRADGDFEQYDMLRMYTIEDGVTMPYFFEAEESDLDNSWDWAEATASVFEEVEGVQIVIEGLTNGGMEYLAVDAVSVTGEIAECLDEDGDGFGDPASDYCSYPYLDCDDTDAATNPYAFEVCDGKDNDCDALVPADEVDADTDGWMTCEGDCHDSDPDINPGVPEDCGPSGSGNGIDENCNDQIDEGCGCFIHALIFSR